LSKDSLDSKTRAEDIILGGLGYDGAAKILELVETQSGILGKGIWDDGEEFEFKLEENLSELELWAVKIILTKI
jgi:hypothetical protein